MGQAVNVDNGGESRRGRTGRGKAAKVLVRPAPRGLPSTVAEKENRPPLSDINEVDWRLIGSEFDEAGSPAASTTIRNTTSAIDGIDFSQITDDQRQALIAVIPELRDRLGTAESQQTPAQSPEASAAPPIAQHGLSEVAEGIAYKPRPARADDSLESGLLLRLGEAASTSVPGYSPSSIADSFVESSIDIRGAIRRPLSENLGQRSRPEATSAAEVVAAAPAVAVTPVVPVQVAPPKPEIDPRRVIQLEAENQALRSTLVVVEQSLADLERSVQHQLSSLEERVLTAMTQLDARCTELLLPTAIVDTDAMETGEDRLVKVVQAVDDRLSPQISALERSGAADREVVESRLSQLEEAISGQVLPGLTMLEQRLAAREQLVEARLVKAEQSIDDVSDDLKLEMSSLSAVFLQQIDAATEKLTAVEQAKMSELEARVNTELGAFAKLSVDFEPIRERIGRIGLEISAAEAERIHLKETMDKRVSGVEAKAELLEVRVIESSSVDIAVYLDRVAEIERAITELNPDRFALVEDLQVLTNRLVSLPPPSVRA